MRKCLHIWILLCLQLFSSHCTTEWLLVIFFYTHQPCWKKKCLKISVIQVQKFLSPNGVLFTLSVIQYNYYLSPLSRTCIVSVNNRNRTAATSSCTNHTGMQKHTNTGIFITWTLYTTTLCQYGPKNCVTWLQCIFFLKLTRQVKQLPG